ncbi:hypothetical protein MMC11_001592 [Xylographa trunciseda]|nr:hypothetical protein [Xylographa trunciseda]
MADAIRTKKAVSERRKQQNQRAQKNYRERRNRRLQMLEALVESGGLPLSGSVVVGAPTLDLCALPQVAADGELLEPLRQLSPSLALCEVWTSSMDAGFPPSETTSQSQSHALLSTISGSSGSGSLSLSTSASSPSTNHDILHRLLQEDDCLDDTTRRSITSGELTVEDVLKAGLSALSKRATSQAASSQLVLSSRQDASPAKAPFLRTDKIFVIENRMQVHTHSLPDPHVNCIRIKQLCALAAVRCNAESLGITFAQLCDEDSDSPFHDTSSVAQYADNTACATRFQHVSPDLRPIAAQLRYRHHPWIDTIPSPTLRQRLIQCISSDPPMVDEDDFCLDLQKDGLVCWGSMLGKAERPGGSGAPWDVRSWEVQPWFLRKWWFVLGGSAGELFQTSKWWNEMRGDCLRYAWQ